MKVYRDQYFLKAKAENYPARSVYKLKEIDERFKLIQKKHHILDLGAAPGSWSLIAADKIGPQGLILACDLQNISVELPANIHFMTENIFEPSGDFKKALADYGPFDLVMSDMAPATTGNKFTDQARSLNLAQEALWHAQKCLKLGGNFVVKVFMGPDLNEFVIQMRKLFSTVKNFKPKSSRAESKETFYIGLGLKDNHNIDPENR